MKWTEEKLNILNTLVLLGKNNKEISEHFKITVKAVQLKRNRLGLKLNINFKKDYCCTECGKTFTDLISNSRKFCSNKCSNSFNNVGRIHRQETKDKISQKLKDKIIVGKLKKERCCNICKNQIVVKYKRICDNCKYSFYYVYKPKCEFDFNVYDYPDNFNIELVKKYGWYSPTNKGNNLDGVSRDHMYSVKDGFINKVNPEVIKHPANCQLLKHTDNSIKNTKSVITLDELYKRIDGWEIF